MGQSARVIWTVTMGWGALSLALTVAMLVLMPGGAPDPPGDAVGETPAPVGFSPLTPERLRALGLDMLPPIAMPPDNPLTDAKVELGKLLFFDRRMSGDGVVSCSSCHVPQKGWGDGNPLSRGYPGTQHWRNSQTIINSAYLQKLFWAGESLNLESQARSAWTGNLAGNLDPDMAEEMMRQMPGYVERFREVFGTDAPSFGDALRAVAAFEATITSRNVPFDLYLAGEADALSTAALRGMALFIDKGGCIQCHGGPLFTDESFHDLGAPPNPEFETDPLRQISLRYQHRARGVPEEVYRTADRDLGLYYTTRQDGDKGKFRTPPLREVGQTGPYMHNGVFQTLREVVEFYNASGGEGPNVDRMLRPLGLTDAEIDDLVAFLEGLTGDPIIVEPPSLPEYAVLDP